MTSQIVYIAAPYSKYPQGIQRAFEHAAKCAAEFVRRGIKAYSPIAHTHPLAIYGDIDPLDHRIWIPFDRAMMDVAAECYVVCMSGWRDSVGMQIEIAEFLGKGKPVRYFSWPDLVEFDPLELVA